MLWEMWAGHRAWKGMTASQILHAVSLEKGVLAPQSSAPIWLQVMCLFCAGCRAGAGWVWGNILMLEGRWLAADAVPGLAKSWLQVAKFLCLGLYTCVLNIEQHIVACVCLRGYALQPGESIMTPQPQLG